MISFATPIFNGNAGSPQGSPHSSESPTSTRSRRFAILPPPPSPQPGPPSPPVPVRSPLRPTPRAVADTPAPDPALSKRKHALIELLSSERAYASDLALIRDIHIPLALGQPAPFPTSPESPSSPASPPGPPMTREDTKIIFGNVEELAVFSEVFCDKLEEALHGVLDPDGDGEDRVGELFLSMIPHLKPPYTTYITRHPTAVAHLNALPQTPALTTYLAQTHTLAQSYTHAWDLPSLLIKPVQRLLKYPLLLSAIMKDTELGQAREILREARDKVEEVARGVNEGRRRWEVVKGVLDGKHPPPVRLKSIRGLRNKSAGTDDHNELERLEKRLHACETFVHDFAKDVVDWTMSLRDAVAHLERWSTTFGRVIGLGQPHGSEALDFFTDIVASQITPIWISLEAAIQTVLLPKLARLLTTTAQPYLLLDHMHALHPQHLQLLDAPLSKARPATSLLDASQSYLALDAQLRAELPRYISLLERGFTACLGQFANWQARFWKEVRAQWVELWDALGVEGDMTAGAADTVKVWWERWEGVAASAAKLAITKPRHDRSSPKSLSPGPTAMLATAFVAGPAPAVLFASSPSPPSSGRPRRHSMQSIDLDIDMPVLGSGGGSSSFGSPMADYAVVASPDSYTSFDGGAGRESDRASVSTRDSARWRDGDRPMRVSSSRPRRESLDKLPTARRESDQPPAVRRDSDRLSTARREIERPSTARPDIERPLTARPDGERPGAVRRTTDENVTPGILKKSSVDSAISSPQPSPRVSIHTSSSNSSSHRLSMHSTDVHVGMDMHVTPRSGSTHASQPAQRPYGTVPVPVVSINDLVSANWMPVLHSTPGSSSGSSSSPGPTSPPDEDTRGRMLKKPSMRKRFTDAFRSPSMKRPGARASVQTISAPEVPRLAPQPPPPEVILNPEKVMYMCTVVHQFLLPSHALPPYRNRPFLVLNLGETLEILSEEGHPRDHQALPIRPEDDECDDCLLLARDERCKVGWALASFLVILS